MNNDEIYKKARQNIIDKKRKEGFKLLETCCYGQLVEFEKEWHKVKGGQTKAETAMVKYQSVDTMRREMVSTNTDVEQMVHTLNWKHIPHDGPFQNGDLKVCHAQSLDTNAIYYVLRFYNNGVWETSSEQADGLTGEVEPRAVKYTLRKKEWSEREKVVNSDVDPKHLVQTPLELDN